MPTFWMEIHLQKHFIPGCLEVCILFFPQCGDGNKMYLCTWDLVGNEPKILKDLSSHQVETFVPFLILMFSGSRVKTQFYLLCVHILEDLKSVSRMKI